MIRRSTAAALALLLLVVCAAAPAAEPLTRAEFQALAVELAPKVNLFRDAWEKDPQAEFYGGTTRDYLYWLLGRLKTKTPDELRKLQAIDIREFIIGESDVDVVTTKHFDFRPGRYGVRKIDPIKADRFDPATDAGKNELLQGYIPVEKIRLGAKGFVPWDGVGDGIGEIFSGKISVHFSKPEEFDSTHYAKEKLNHPILLALRYLRLVAMDYFRRHGAEYPDRKVLFGIDETSGKAVREVIRNAVRSGELAEYLAKPKFREWLNATIRKAFYSYTNPTAGKLLFDEYGVSELVSVTTGIEPYNQYLFSRYPEPEKVAARLAENHVDPAKLYSPVSRFFPDGQLFHGTRTEQSFRGILFQGILPSEAGSAGPGLYGVAETNLDFAEKWAGAPERVVRFEISPTAKIADVTQGEGKALFESSGLTLDAFAEAYGIDIIKYEYPTEAFVVKNSAVLSRPRGHRVELMALPALLARAKAAKSRAEAEAMLKLLKYNYLSLREMDLVLDALASHCADREVRAACGALSGMMKDPRNPPARLPKLAETVMKDLSGEYYELANAMSAYYRSRLCEPGAFAGSRAKRDTSDFLAMFEAWVGNGAMDQIMKTHRALIEDRPEVKKRIREILLEGSPDPELFRRKRLAHLRLGQGVLIRRVARQLETDWASGHPEFRFMFNEILPWFGIDDYTSSFRIIPEELAAHPAETRELLAAIARILKKSPDAVDVEGHKLHDAYLRVLHASRLTDVPRLPGMGLIDPVYCRDVLAALQASEAAAQNSRN